MHPNFQHLVDFFTKYHTEHAANASRGERVFVDAGTLRELSAAHGSDFLMSLLGGWEQDGDVVILGDWDTLPEDAPGIELIYG
jgi:hypothetical protein